MKPVPIVGAVVVLALAGFTWSRSHGAKVAEPTQYKLSAASIGDVRKTVSASGTLQPWTTVDVKSKAGGRIDLLAVDLGSVVKTGQIIAKIDPTDSQLTFDQAQADTQAAQAKEAQSGQSYELQIKQSDADIKQAKAQLDNARGLLAAAVSRQRSAKDQETAQPSLTAASIRQAKANYDAAVQDRAHLRATQAQDRASAQSTYDQALANYKNNEANLTRQKSLLARGFVSQQTVDTAQATADVTKSEVSSAKTKLDTLSDEQQTSRESADAKVAQTLAAWHSAQAQSIDVPGKHNSRTEADASVSQSAAQVALYEAQLSQAIANKRNIVIKQLDIANAKAGTTRAKASMTNAKSTLDQTVVGAPSDGVVLKKYVEQGTIITSGLSLNTSGASIVEIGDISRMYVDVSVDETDIAKVKIGQTVDVSFDAYPGVPFAGKVVKIDPQAQVESNVTTVHVRVEVDNKAPSFHSLKPAMNATCEFVVGEAHSVLTVSSDAIHNEGGVTTVDVATGGKTAPVDPATGMPPDPNTRIGIVIERRTVQVGQDGNDTTEIKSGLQAGEMVVTQTIIAAQAAPAIAGAAAFGGPPKGGPGPH